MARQTGAVGRPSPLHTRPVQTVLGLWQVEVSAAGTLAQAVAILERPEHCISTVFVCATLLAESASGQIDALRRSAAHTTVAAMLGPRETPPPALQGEGTALLTLMKPVTPRALHRALGAVPLIELPVAAKTAAPSLSGLRVLLAEDNEVNVIVATAHLEAMGASVERAATGGEALAMAQSTAFDVR